MLIALEGIDGAGKTTTAALVAKQLTDRGHLVVSTSKRDTAIRDPFAREQIQAVGERLWGIPHDARMNAVGSLHWVFLNAAYFAATHHALEEEMAGQVVIMDNWINKLIARMASNGEFELDELLTMTAPVPQPDVVIMLDVSPHIAGKRREFSDAERGLLSNSHNTFESFQEIVRKNLLRMASHYSWDILAPGDADATEVASAVVTLVERKIP